MIQFCRVCTSPRLNPLWPDEDGNLWHRCAACGSDSSESLYRRGLYGQQFLDKSLQMVGGFGTAKEALRTNIEWFDQFRTVDKNDFLDIGCLEGGALAVAAEHRWSVHGFDIDPSSGQAGCTTIYPFFAANLFPQMYHAIHCREVIEHIDGWRAFLAELTAVLHPGGLLQVQTPRPWHENHRLPYQPSHLQLLSPPALEAALRRHGFNVIDRREWECGQAVMCELVDKP